MESVAAPKDDPQEEFLDMSEIIPGVLYLVRATRSHLTNFAGISARCPQLQGSAGSQGDRYYLRSH